MQYDTRQPGIWCSSNSVCPIQEDFSCLKVFLEPLSRSCGLSRDVLVTCGFRCCKSWTWHASTTNNIYLMRLGFIMVVGFAFACSVPHDLDPPHDEVSKAIIVIRGPNSTLGIILSWRVCSVIDIGNLKMVCKPLFGALKAGTLFETECHLLEVITDSNTTVSPASQSTM